MNLQKAETNRFELNTRYFLEAPAGTISETGVGLIQRFISDQNLQDEAWKKKNPDKELQHLYALPAEWDWVWLVPDGEYRGTFAKRVSKYYYKTFGLKVPDAFTQQVGNLAREHSETETRYEFEFVNEFDWQSGDFGDYDSCFWGGRSRARKLLKEQGALAICFYHEGKGKARAWVALIENDPCIVFNGYGFMGNPTLKIAQVMSRFLERQYKRIYLTNHGVDDRLLWVNSGVGYLIGTQEQINPVEEYDFGWGSPDDDEDEDSD